MELSDGTEVNNEDVFKLPDAWSGWKVTERIGTGSFGTVYLAEKDGQECAVKVINIPADESERASLLVESKNEQTAQVYLRDLVENYSDEIRTMYSLQENPHIVRIEDHLTEELEPFGFRIYIRMELLTPMRDYFSGRRVTEEEAVQVGLDICDALTACDSHRIIHRDIKPDNIFVSEEGLFKLGDFGTARQLDLTFGTYSAKGTFSFMAPEVYKQERYNKQVDLYSLGIVLYRMMNRNRDPFVDPEKQLIYYQDREEAIRRRMDGEPLPKPIDASEKFSSVIRRACAFKASNRYPDAAAMRADLLKVLDPEAEIPVYREPDINPEKDGSLTDRTDLPENRPAKDPAAGKRRRVWGTVLIVLAFGIAMVFLLRNMNAEHNTVNNRHAEQTEEGSEIPVGVTDEKAGAIPAAEERTVTDDLKEAAEAAKEIASDLSAYALEDKKRFSSYFVNADDSGINNYFVRFQEYNWYDNNLAFPIAEKDGLYLVDLIGYKSGEQTSDTEKDFSIGYRMYLSKSDGEWKVDLDQEKIEALEQLLIEEGYYPEGYAAGIRENVHNVIMENGSNFMYLDDTLSYQDFRTKQVLFIWQEENGDILVSILFANGTTKEQVFRNIRIMLNDTQLGTVLEGRLPEDIAVKSGHNFMQTFRFPAEDVKTGMKDWQNTYGVIEAEF